MPDVFISYAREDVDVARRLAQRFEAEGLSVWWDQDIPFGSTWDEQIGTQLAVAKRVIVIWSTSSVASKWVRAEAHLADKRGVLLPIIINNAPPPPPFNLTQSVDLTGWTGDGNDERLSPLLNAIARTVPPSPERRDVRGPSSRVANPWYMSGRRLLALAAISAVVAGGAAWYGTRRDPPIDEVKTAKTLVDVADMLRSFEENRPASGRAESLALEQMRATLDQAITANPNSSQLRRMEAERLRVAGDSEGAIAYCLRAIADIPDDGLLYGELGYLYRLSKQEDKAIEAFKKSIALDGDRGVLAIAYTNLAEIYADRTDAALAKDAFRAALRLNRNRSDVCRRIIERVSTDEAFSDMMVDVQTHCS